MKHPKIFLATFLLIAASALYAGISHEKETASGITYGNDAADKVAFHGAAPVAQRSGAAQTALTDSTGGSTANATLAAVTAPSALTDSSTGAASTTLAALSALSTSDTYTDAAVNAKLTVIKNAIASLAARQAENRAAIAALTDAAAKEAKLLNELRAALVEKGLITGS